MTFDIGLKVGVCRISPDLESQGICRRHAPG
jgi:hypothetical protein